MKTCTSCGGPISIRERWCPACNEPVDGPRTPLETAWWHLDQAVHHIREAVAILSFGGAGLGDATKRLRSTMTTIEARLERGDK